MISDNRLHSVNTFAIANSTNVLLFVSLRLVVKKKKEIKWEKDCFFFNVDGFEQHCEIIGHYPRGLC